MTQPKKSKKTLGIDEVPNIVGGTRTKRNRMRRSKNKKRYYFTAETQEAIEQFQSATDQAVRERLYIEKILPAFDALVENLICIYKFTGLHDSHEDLKNDCITFLYETLNKFDPKRGTKAFSYFNVVAKNWLIVQSKKRQQVIKRMISLDAYDQFGRDGYDSYTQENFDDEGGIADLNDQFVDDSSYITAVDAQQRFSQLMKLLYEIRSRLVNENEIYCIDSIITLFERRDDLPMLNKRAIFAYIRELSGLSPKQLTLAIATIRSHYSQLKLDEEFDIF